MKQYDNAKRGGRHGRRAPETPPHARLEPLEPRVLLSATGMEADDVASSGGALTPVATGGTLVRQAENLDRGVVALRTGRTSAYVSWRLLGLDPTDIAFNVYRSTDGGTATKLNFEPVTLTTDFVDNSSFQGSSQAYYVRPVIGGVEGDASETFTLAAGSPIQQYQSVPITPPPGGTTPDGSYTYTANDASVGDVDGDGQYEIILKWDPTNAKDNAHSGYTGNVFVDAYELDGTQLWRIDLGRNIRAGAHYTQFTVYDLDGDGRAEVAMKSAPGTVDGQGNFVLMGSDDPNADYRNGSGYVLTGPEYFTVFDGYTGAELDTVALEPERGSVSQWGDNYGNRVDRFTSGVAYLDGENPSAILGRGYYGPQSGLQARNEVAAYDFRDTNGDGTSELSVRWVFEALTNGQNSEYIGEGAHSLTVGDVDGDGFDEVVYGAAVIDHDGTGLYATELGHGDALHLSDMDPTRPGLEVFMVHEGQGAYESQGRDAGGEYRAAEDGTLLFQIPSNNDVGRGVAGDIDPNHLGYEFWATTNQGTRMIYNVDGTALYATPGNMMYNFVIHWDGDLSHELLDGTTISEWNNPGRSNIVTAHDFGAASNNGTKSTPALQADLFGDWREEVIWRNSSNTELQIWSTTDPASDRIHTLMHDTQYRVSVAAQNSAYNQPPHPSFYLGEGMSAPPTPNISYTAFTGTLPQVPVTISYQAEDANVSGEAGIESVHAGYNGTGYVNSNTAGTVIEFTDVDGGAGGTVTLGIRFALGNNARTGNLVVNGVSEAITFPSTTDWDNWTNYFQDVQLAAGQTNTIRLESTGQDLANIDEIRVTVVPTVTVLPGDFNGSGQVEQGDLDLVLQNWGVDTDAAGIPNGWVADNDNLGLIEQSELDRVLQNWGNTAAPAAPIDSAVGENVELDPVTAGSGEDDTDLVLAATSADAPSQASLNVGQAQDATQTSTPTPTQEQQIQSQSPASSQTRTQSPTPTPDVQADSAGDDVPVAVEAAPAATPVGAGAPLVRQAEDLDRGLVALRTGRTSVYLSWRLLGLDPSDIAFNVYRSTGGAAVVKLNATPITQTTDYVDNGSSGGATQSYFVRPVVNGVEGDASEAITLQPSTVAEQFLSVPLDPPPGGVTDDGEAYTYTANDGSVADLDGDGDYEIILKWEPTNWKHATTSGQTGNQIYDAYTLEGERLWRIDMGINIRSGPQYSPFQAYDYDGDGRAEFVVKTAPGTIDGVGNVIAINGDDPNADWRNASGHINDGPEYLTVFDGFTGEELATVDLQPERGPLSSWGDTYGNRANQFLMVTAYLDGERPSIVFSRDYNHSQAGLPGRDELAAYNWRDGQLTLEWHFKAHVNWENNENPEYEGQGNHQLSVADVDGDGFDEIIRGASIIDHDGTGYYSSGAGHGDALHVGDFDPSNPGIEVFLSEQSPGEYSNVQGFNVGGHLYDADTKQVLVGIPANNDVGRGVAMDIDPNYPGAEMWATTNDPNGGSRYIYNVDGSQLYQTPSNMYYNSGVWWDADPLRELLDNETISKWHYEWANPGRQNIVQAWQQGATDNNGTKANAVLSGDILGDWREEVIWRNTDSTELQIWTTTIPAADRLYTLMHDSQYRTAIAWQNNLYNQPPHPSFFLGAGMAAPPTPNISYTAFTGTLPQAPVTDTYQAEDATLTSVAGVQSAFGGYNGTGYVNFNTAGSVVEFADVNGGEGGNATLTIRFALGNAARTGDLVINGTVQPITFHDTGGFDQWEEIQLQINLNPGTNNTIRLESTGDDLANIDQISVQYRPAAASALAGDFNGTGQVEQGDLDLVLQNWGASATGLPASWINDRPDSGLIDQAELDLVLLNWGATGSSGGGTGGGSGGGGGF